MGWWEFRRQTQEVEQMAGLSLGGFAKETSKEDFSEMPLVL